MTPLATGGDGSVGAIRTTCGDRTRVPMMYTARRQGANVIATDAYSSFCSSVAGLRGGTRRPTPA
jgi:hypothetical protein